MVPFFTLRGYTAADPLDTLTSRLRYFLIVGMVFIVSVIYFWVVFYRLEVFLLPADWLIWVEIVFLTIVYGSIVVFLRKASSVILILIMMLLGVPMDLYLESYYRAAGLTAMWEYNVDGLLGSLHPLLQIFIAWFVDGLVIGVLALWVARLSARFFTSDDTASGRPTGEERVKLFTDEWTNEPVKKPGRDLAFYVLRLLGLGYLAYFLLILIGLLGTTPYPEQLRGMLDMTYLNPALMINSLIKISLMFVLLFIGAYNKTLRWYCVLIVIFAHFVSTVGSVGLYLNAPAGDAFRDFLMMSAIIDAVIVIGFGIILFNTGREPERFGRRKEFPAFYSFPYFLTSTVFYCIGIVFALMFVAVLYFRFMTDGTCGLGAVFGFPDPQVLNTITAYTTLSFLAILLAQREVLRENLSRLIFLSFFIMTAGSALWMVFSIGDGGVSITTRHETIVAVDRYFVVLVIIGIVVLAGLIALRKMYYTVEYSINAMNPSTARAVMALHGALFDGTANEQSEVLECIDRHIAGVRGRRRGMLNFPFWIVEHIISPIYGLRPNFSTMDARERRFYLRKYILRQPHERDRSMVPNLAHQVYMIGTALHSFITLGNYSLVDKKREIGFVPPDARDRLQGDYAEGPPPYKKIAELPDSPEHPANFKPEDRKKDKPLVAPRVVTPVDKPRIPDEVDYLVVGSGAGGGVMAYRLACAVEDPSKILVVERGKRYSPLQDFNDDEMEMIRKLYKEGGLQMSKRFDLIVLQGECVGGTTVMNNSVCFEMPEGIKSIWEEKYGLDLSPLQEENNSIAQELEIGPIAQDGINTRVQEKFEKGIKAYNENTSDDQKFVSEVLKANQRNILGSGMCNLGNKRMRKRSVLETYIPWSEARGVQVVSDTSAVRFIKDGRRAVEVVLRTNIGTMKRVRVNKAIVTAGGVIASSHFLMRSMSNKSDPVRKNVGRGLSCNFAFPFVFEFDDILDAFDGVQITLGALDKQHRAVFETYFNPPGSFAISVPFFFDRHHDIMKSYRKLVNYGVLVGSEPNGRISERADPMNGRAFSWKLGESDIAHIKYALETALEIGIGSGAKRAVVPSDPGIELKLTRQELDRFKKALAEYPLKKSDLQMMTAHPQGGNRMAGDNSKFKSERVVDGRFRVDGLDNVYVADASVFPEGITINPQWTIMSMSSLAAKSVLADSE